MKADHIGNECQRNSNFPARAAQYHARLVEMLTASSNPETADWFTNYLKGEITYRGLKTGMLRGILAEFHEVTQIDQLPDEVQLGQMRYWLAKPMAEDQLTAILWLQKWLKLKSSTSEAPTSVGLTLEMLEDVFRVRDIHDWSTNDWLCVKVLEIIPEQHSGFIPMLMNWVNADSLWQRRSCLLAFKKCGKRGKYLDEIEVLIDRLLPSEERFVLTAVGWVLSDASRQYMDWAANLFEKYFDRLSHELIVRHAKYLPNYDDIKRRSRERKE